MKIFRGKRGFTLIELLVVIAIIAILAAILFPVYARLREKARQTQCVSNIKQTSLAFKTYTDDYDQKYPYVGTYTGVNWTAWPGPPWPAPMDPYIKSPGILACPSAGCTGVIGDGIAANKPFSYFFNRRLSGQSEGIASYPSNCIIIGDWAPAAFHVVGANGADSTCFDIWRVGSNPNEAHWLAGDRHSPGAVYGFVDGHGDILISNTATVPTDAQKSSMASFWP